MVSDRGAVSSRMRPGAWDECGFLGVEEGLSERIDADAETCAQLGTTPEALGKGLLHLLARATEPDEDLDDDLDTDLDTGLDTGLDTELDTGLDTALGVDDASEGTFDVEPAVVVTIERHPERITCPWALEPDEVCLSGPGGNPSADRFTITVDGTTLEGFTLSAHLIANHRFFGGLESRFRIDPTRALVVLGVLADD